ncbi:MAG: saccharopine dehydrogenase NADP-binding domain-containing protein [Pseudomonadota bacterium]
MTTSDRRFDFVLFGASGFTGRLTALYLAAHAPAAARWALAGRSLDKLARVRAEIAAVRPEFACIDLFVVDSSDASALASVAASTRVITTTVGPYILHGEPLVAACAAAGTDYLDLTGEPEFVDAMWLAHHAQAVRTGARLVHACGFDSIPHDLGAYFCAQQLPKDLPVRMRGYVSAQGTFSAGTFHSAVHAFSRLGRTARAAAQRHRQEALQQGQSSAPVRQVGAVSQGLHRAPSGAGMPRGWAVPLPTIDPQMVKRSARTLAAFGPDFRYGHFVVLPKLRQVLGLVVGVGVLVLLAQVPPLKRWLLASKVSGEGPDAAQRARASFSVTFVAEAVTPSGPQRLLTQVSGGDPGYGETSKMLAESTLCMAYDTLPKVSGQVTTAVVMGDALVRRLQAAGIGFAVMER